ncbi:DUF302 domain-containing protein [Aestuariimicrobium sp. T2.26MG-19.2B]|uniref:DUF302 domain-containing protein n=1 Tax=Aestuariimicrobium sp. T2.26MG-19.2B TaxID=3040679 RepID=UPI0024773F35|nr:DUF302 domain-containing protein [Aestuariimicrobium sp. T2.26MG-19.2B]CAI9404477.1 hypothetical protein AESSP_01216 [Aestuariimicrobium sp. T2.26MG-19.2B]
MGYALSTIVYKPFDQTLAATREALAAQGFGVLTEIDLAATLRKKLEVEIPPQVILGACNPPSAYAALQAEESIGVLLPCNVVVRSVDEASTVVEAIDPQTMHELTGNEAMAPVAERIGGMLQGALDSLTS